MVIFSIQAEMDIQCIYIIYGGDGMNSKDWQKELDALCRVEPWYRQCLRDTAAAEPGFETLRESLTAAQRETLDRYIAACEEQDHARLLLAYELGRTHGRRQMLRLQEDR